MKAYRRVLDFIEEATDQFWNIVWFCRNVWFFRDQLKNHRHWDYSYCLDLFIKSLERLADTIEKKDRHMSSKESAMEIRDFCFKLAVQRNPFDYVEMQMGYKPNSEVWWEEVQVAQVKAEAQGRSCVEMPPQSDEAAKYYTRCSDTENEMWDKAWADFTKQARGWWD